jgi:hypothetical protein
VGIINGLAFFPVVAISTNLSTFNISQQSKQKKSEKPKSWL